VKILITGVAGFLGSNLLKRFIDDTDHIITGLDDFSTGSESNLKAYTDLERIEFIEADIRTFDFGTSSFDMVLNFACPASPNHYQTNPVKTLETNFLGMRNILDYAKKSQAIVVQSSTSEIYGDPLVSPQTETYWGNVNPIGLRSCYDEGKRAAETLCFDYMREFNVDARVIRIFNTYGPQMAIDDGRVVSNFITQALKNKDITIYGKGDQTRSFCYVDDLVDGIMKIINLKNAINFPVNLGNPNEISVLNLAKLIINKTKSQSRLIYKELPQDDPTQRNPDINLASKLLSWEPKIDLEQGLEKTIDYFDRIL
jgi:UDP-glucuronate decarboxylase